MAYFTDAVIATSFVSADVTEEAKNMVVEYEKKIGKEEFCRKYKPQLDTVVEWFRKEYSKELEQLGGKFATKGELK
jgi:hypothetical protein